MIHNLFSSLISILLTFIVLVDSSSSSWVDVGSDLIGRVVHIESLRYRGYWLDSEPRPSWSRVRPIREEHVFCEPRSKFKVWFLIQKVENFSENARNHQNLIRDVKGMAHDFSTFMNYNYRKTFFEKETWCRTSKIFENLRMFLTYWT